MQVYIGIDWSESKHDVAYMNEKGAILALGVIEHTLAGLLKLEAMRQRLGGRSKGLSGWLSSHICMVEGTIKRKV